MSESYFAAIGRRRSKLEVKISILRAIEDGATRQTNIMNRSNLSWSFANMFIHTLERQGLISTMVVRGRRCFTLTERGKRALAAYTTVIRELEVDMMGEEIEVQKEKTLDSLPLQVRQK